MREARFSLVSMMVTGVLMTSCVTNENEVLSASADEFGSILEEDAVSWELESAPWKAEAPEFIRDVNGWTWIRSHEIKYTTPELVDPVAYDGESDERGESSEPDPFKASDYEYGYYFRPLADIGGWEYHLDDESIEKLGERLRARELARREGLHDIPNLYEAPGESIVKRGEVREPSMDDDVQILRSVDRSSAAKVIGTDDRVEFNGWAGVYPLSVHGALVYPSSWSHPYGTSGCTVFKAVNRYSAATSAHCLYDADKKTWNTRLPVQFMAGLLEVGGTAPPAVPAGCYTRVVSANYGDHSNLAKNDYGVLIFNGNGSSWCAAGTYDFGHVGWKSVGIGADFESYLFGYPAEQPLPAGWPSYLSLSYSLMTGGIGQTVFQPNVVRHQHDTTGGQSGTALLSYSSTQGYQARAIHKGPGSGNYNVSREFNGTVADWINAFIGE